MKPNLILPNRTGHGESEIIQTQTNIVLVGANGSGKTRLGVWIEKITQNHTLVHRISSQRALRIPYYAEVKNLEQAERSLFYGNGDQQGTNDSKNAYRWNRKPETHLLDDFNALLSTLFARESKRDSDYTKASEETGQWHPVSKSEIGIITKLWSEVMPHRQISFKDGKVTAIQSGQTEYHGQEMSDGERVVLYLIGQCLCAPDNSIIIIDEPEIHLHKSLMNRLWNQIEEVCPNKLFVFITHDLDFAASRKDAKKFWIKSYNGIGCWKWEEVPEIESIPENLVFEILGSRKDVIFCEGEKSSDDTTIYQLAFPNYHVIGRGSCEKVIESTKAFRNSPSLHHLKVHGIIDRDYRVEEEITALQTHGIHTIDVAEIENLFCTEPILRIVAKNQAHDEDEIVEKVTKFVLECLKGELELQITNRTEREIRFRLGKFSRTQSSVEGLNEGLTSVVRNINVESLYQENEQLFQKTISEGNLELALRLYNKKGLRDRIAPIFDLPKEGYKKLVFRLLKTDKKDEIVSAFRQFIPRFT